MRLGPLVASILFGVAIGACASMDLGDAPALKYRRLKISDRPGNLEYQIQKCVKKFIVCREWAPSTEFYDLNDTATRNMLRDTGFVLVVEGAVRP